MPQRNAWRGPWRWPQWVIDWHEHPGQRMRVGNGEEHERPARSWHIYAPGTPYLECHQGPAAGNVYDLFYFFFSLAKPWAPLAGRPFTVVVDDDELLAPHVDAMFAIQSRGETGHQLGLQGHALIVLGEILTASLRGGAGSPDDPWRIRTVKSANASLLHRVDREALRDLRRPPVLDDLAERLGMSVSGLCHRFKAETGMTVMARLRWLRVREARRLLGSPGATVKEVAWQLGYSSPFHLSRQFHAISGMTAADFLTRQR